MINEEDQHLAGKAWQLPFKIDVKGARSVLLYSKVPKVPVPVITLGTLG